jgi:hypothetical protein
MTALESKILQMVIMRNKKITTIDLSELDDPTDENLNHVLGKVDSHAFMKHLFINNIKQPLTSCMWDFSPALGANKQLETLSMRCNKIKSDEYYKFWEGM